MSDLDAQIAQIESTLATSDGRKSCSPGQLKRMSETLVSLRRERRERAGSDGYTPLGARDPAPHPFDFSDLECDE